MAQSKARFQGQASTSSEKLREKGKGVRKRMCKLRVSWGEKDLGDESSNGPSETKWHTASHGWAYRKPY